MEGGFGPVEDIRIDNEEYNALYIRHYRCNVNAPCVKLGDIIELTDKRLVKVIKIKALKYYAREVFSVTSSGEEESKCYRWNDTVIVVI